MDINTFGLELKEVVATAWLFACWGGYSLFARYRARSTFCIASALHTYRQQWMTAMLRRENRISDASLLASLERNASFLASTSILIIAGLVTTLASVEKVHSMLEGVPFTRADLTPLALQFKIGIMLMIYIYSFFTFTWAMRQYGFCAVLLGAAPSHDDEQALLASGDRFAYYSAKVIDQAGHSYNYGLRGYYFSLTVLAWLMNTWFFVIAVGLVVAVLYAREFHSNSLRALIKVGDLSLAKMKNPRTW